MNIPDLDLLIKKAKETWDQMPKDQQDKMIKQQRESWSKSIVDWPKPNYYWEGTTKVYDSLEDYHND